MPTKVIPVTTYQIKQSRPDYPVGSPAVLAVSAESQKQQKILVNVPIDMIPVDATVTSAVLQFWAAEAKGTSSPATAKPPTEQWKSSVTWAKRPALGAAIVTKTVTPALNTLYDFVVTAWVASRSRKGLALETTTTTTTKFWGSAAAENKPVLVVDYYVGNDIPTGLTPQGGAVSVPAPILTYTGDEDMDHQQIQFSTDGTEAGIVYDTGSIAATTGRYAPSGASPVLAVGAGTYWRVRTSGGGGESPWSPWVRYTYRPIAAPVITNPPSETDDGSPTMTWTLADQESWQAEIFDGSTSLEKSGWDANEVTRDWTPSKGVAVPGGLGRLVLRTTDSITPRVAAEGAPIWAEVEKVFTTVLNGTGPAITDLEVSFDDPVPVLTGTRALGIPDEVALMRDGVIVSLWDDDGVPRKWAPGADFFTGTSFTIPDYTADPRREHTWNVMTRTDGVRSVVGPDVTDIHSTRSVWILDPRTGKKIEVLGNNGVPAVAQAVEEASVLHTPVHGDLVVESIRRRLVRTTRSGSIEGLVLNQDEDTLQEWALADSALRYRLIFGKVNWPIIFGDYSPTDIFYSHPDPRCDDTVVLVNLNWWERLAD